MRDSASFVKYRGYVSRHLLDGDDDLHSPGVETASMDLNGLSLFLIRAEAHLQETRPAEGKYGAVAILTHFSEPLHNSDRDAVPEARQGVVEAFVVRLMTRVPLEGAALPAA